MAQLAHTVDRRTLIQRGALAATALAARAPLGARAEEAPAEAVSIPKIDVHAHALPPCYLEGLAAQGLAPEDEDGFPTPAWDEDAHLAFMDDTGIDYAVLSLSTPHIHCGDDEKALPLPSR